MNSIHENALKIRVKFAGEEFHCSEKKTTHLAAIFAKFEINRTVKIKKNQ